jgi:hypothetical protein
MGQSLASYSGKKFADASSVVRRQKNSRARSDVGNGQSQDNRRRTIFKDSFSQEYVSVTLQVVDERSDFKGEDPHPLSGVVVRIPGTNYSAKTDAVGVVTFDNIPTGSRVLMTLDDPIGRVNAGVVEIPVGFDGGDLEVFSSVRMLRSSILNSYYSIAQSALHAARGSFCINVLDDRAASGVDGLALDFDINIDKLLYFNKYGFTDLKLQRTTENGRVCALGVDPGPLNVNVYDSSNALVGSTLLNIIEGRHLEEVFYLNQTNVSEPNLLLSIAAASTATEQLSSDLTAANSLKLLDSGTMVVLGDQNHSTPNTLGYVEIPARRLDYLAKDYIFSDTPEFEQTLYTVDTHAYDWDKGPLVLPQFARGYVDDMAQYANTFQDYTLGSVVFEHRNLLNENTDALQVSLVNDRGEEVSAPWYFSDQPTTKVMFFNVPPGVYSLIVQSKEKYLVSSKTISVFSETLTYSSSGAILRERW